MNGKRQNSRLGNHFGAGLQAGVGGGGGGGGG